jgi:hypothetical protein
MYSLEEILYQAINHKPSIKCNSHVELFAIGSGVKICKDKGTNTITLFNTTKGGDNYTKLDRDELEVFKTIGWEQGIAFMSYHNATRKLNIVRNRIQLLMNKPKFSQKKYEELKKSRDYYMKKISKLLIILN